MEVRVEDQGDTWVDLSWKLSDDRCQEAVSAFQFRAINYDRLEMIHVGNCSLREDDGWITFHLGRCNASNFALDPCMDLDFQISPSIFDRLYDEIGNSNQTTYTVMPGFFFVCYCFIICIFCWMIISSIR